MHGIEPPAERVSAPARRPTAPCGWSSRAPPTAASSCLFEDDGCGLDPETGARHGHRARHHHGRGGRAAARSRSDQAHLQVGFLHAAQHARRARARHRPRRWCAATCTRPAARSRSRVLLGHETRFKVTLAAVAGRSAGARARASGLSSIGPQRGLELRPAPSPPRPDPPARTAAARTVPAYGAVTVCSIFMASMVMQRRAALTLCADAHMHGDHRAGERRHQRARVRLDGGLQRVLGAGRAQDHVAAGAEELERRPRIDDVGALRACRRSRPRAEPASRANQRSS